MGNPDFDAYLKRARNYLLYFPWAERIDAEFTGYFEEGIVSVFLFRLVANRDGIDPWIWVIVGDLPSAYIPCYDIATPYAALDGYIYEMERWARAVNSGDELDNCYPVDAEPTQDMAKKLLSRTSFLSKKILPEVPGGPTPQP